MVENGQPPLPILAASGSFQRPLPMRSSAAGTVSSTEDAHVFPFHEGSHHIVWGSVEASSDSSADSGSSIAEEQVGPDTCATQPSVHSPFAYSSRPAGDLSAARGQFSRELVPQPSGTDNEEAFANTTAADFFVADLFSDGEELQGDWPSGIAEISIDELLTDEETQELLAIVPVDDHGALTSIGSLDHRSGPCKKACLFVHTRMGCRDGILCEFCHFPHNRKNKVRPCKGKRDRYSRLIARRQAEVQNHHDVSQAPSGIFPSVPLEAGTTLEQLRASIVAKFRTHSASADQSPPPAADQAHGARATGGSASSSSAWGVPQQLPGQPGQR